MSKPSKPVFGTNAVQPSSMLSAGADLAEYAANPPACIAARVASQSIPTGATTAVLNDTEVVDTVAMFAATSATITIVDSGVYTVAAGGLWALNGTGDRIVMIFVNGAELVGGGQSAPGSAANLIRQSASQCALLVAGNTVEMRAFQSSGGALGFTGRLSVVRVSGT